MIGQKLLNKMRCVVWCIVMMQQPVTRCVQQWSFATNRIPQTSQHLNVVLLCNCLTLWSILMMNYTLLIKENCEHDLDIAPNLTVWEMMATSTARISFLGHNHKPMTRHQ